jgi:5-methylphenazine-1-carboxylate 1-monooxygenase
MQVLIVGGGIGGLAVALSLHAAGIGCTVFEQVRKPAELGVGPLLAAWPATMPADSGDVARSFRDHVARCSDMMSPA